MEGAVVIGVSAGGITALKTILPKLPRKFCLPIIVVFHRPPESDDFLERFLDSECAVTVKRAHPGEKITPGTVYIAPPNFHLLIEENFTFSFSQAPPVNHARPSIDVLFDSAADVYGHLLTGIILTGANNDGSRGLKNIKDTGGLTAAQDPDTAEIPQMPRAAITAANPPHILPLIKIPEFLTNLCH
jgi:two-component system chemotaxis response regulator CheB